MKMEHMDKLLIERDNNQHNANRKYKKVVVEKENIAKEAEFLREEKELIVGKYEKRLKQIKDTL